MGGVGDYSGAGSSLTYLKYVLVWNSEISWIFVFGFHIPYDVQYKILGLIIIIRTPLPWNQMNTVHFEIKIIILFSKSKLCWTITIIRFNDACENKLRSFSFSLLFSARYVYLYNVHTCIKYSLGIWSYGDKLL